MTRPSAPAIRFGWPVFLRQLARSVFACTASAEASDRANGRLISIDFSPQICHDGEKVRVCVGAEKEGADMKRIGRMLALLVSMLLLVGLTACTPRSVVGSWRCTVDLSRAAQAAGALDGLDEQSGVGVVLAKLLDGQTLELALELRKDGTYSLGTDPESARAAADSLSARMGELMPELLSELLGVDPAEVEAAMAITGMTPEAIAEKLMEQIQLDGAIDSIAAKASTGTYRYEDGKLWLTPDGQTENAEAYETVVLSREGLRITETRSGLFQKYEKILPLTFKR